MQIWPAIDLLGGKAVRLTKGNYEQVKVYFDDPDTILSYFQTNGASHLHVVDLDGAKDGSLANFETIRKLAKANAASDASGTTGKLTIEVGGGIRSEERIVKYLELGVSHVILGTKAAEDPAFAEAMLKKYGSAIVIGVDSLHGKVAVRGWKDITDLSATEFCRQMQQMGATRVICTDISKDGCLSGTNLSMYKELTKELELNITASGGITSLEEVKALKRIGLHSAIIGKAIYEGKLDLKKILESGEEYAC